MTLNEIDHLLDGDRLVGGQPKRLVTFRGWTAWRGRTLAVLQDDSGAWYVEEVADLQDSRPTDLTALELTRRCG